jgi:hypothetical protein
MLEDQGSTVVVKVIGVDSTECRNVQQLLGQLPWHCGALGSTGSAERLWETLHLVPLVVDGLARVPDYPHVVAMVMRKLVPLAELSQHLLDVTALLHVVAQLVVVRCLQSSACHDVVV